MLPRCAVVVLLAFMLTCQALPPAVHAASLAANPRVEVFVHGTSVRWWGSAAGGVVRAELSGPNGLKALAVERETPITGLDFATSPEDLGARILPGDRVTIRPSDGDAVTMLVPELVADVDGDTDRIAGRAPVGTAVSIYLREEELLGTLAPADTGDFILDVAGQHDLRPDDRGTVRLAGTDGTTFITWWEVMSARLWLGKGRIELATSLGSTVIVDAVSPDGRRRTFSYTPLRGYASGDSQCLDCPQLMPGTVVTVTKASGVPMLDHQWSGELPEMSVRLDQAANMVRGHGPAGATFTLLADEYSEVRRGAAAVRETVTADGTGSIELDLTGRATIRRGWLARLEQWPDGSVQIVREDLLRRYRVTLYGRLLEALGAANAPITVTVRAEDGSLKGTIARSSSADGLTSFSLGPVVGTAPDSLAFLPGDQITIEEYAVGDPTVGLVPKVTMRTDVGGNRVLGDCPPGFDIEVGDSANGNVMTAAWRDGGYEADFAGSPVVAPGKSGPVIFREVGGPFEYYGGWAATSIELTVGGASTVGAIRGGASVAGIGIGGRTVQVAWLTADGAMVGAYSERIEPNAFCCTGSGEPWDITLVDSAGGQTRMVTGDRFVVQVGDDRVELLVPPLDLAIDVETDVISGHTIAAASVAFTVNHWGTTTANDRVFGQTAADSTGFFRHSFAGEFDLQHRDQIGTGVTTPDGYKVQLFHEAPGLLVDLTAASVMGTTLPEADLIVTLTDGAQQLARIPGRTTGDGAFLVEIRDRSGRRVPPRVGQHLTVIASRGTQQDKLFMTMPELDFALDRQSNVVRGRASPGGDLAVKTTTQWFFQRAFHDGGGLATGAEAIPTIAPNGAWTARGEDFTSMNSPRPITLVPGVGILGRYRLADGDLVMRTRYVPIINVEHGGPRVCGVGQPGDPVGVLIRDEAGTITSRASGTVGDDMRFELRLTDAMGRPKLSRTGQSVHATLGNDVIDLTLPPLSTSVAWDLLRPGFALPITQVSGQASPFRTVSIHAQAQDCFRGTLRGLGGGSADTDETGVFRATIPHQPAGSGIEVAIFDPSHHRFFHHVFRSQARIFVDTDRVAGHASAGSAVTLTLLTSAGFQRAREATLGDVDGRYEVRFRDERGQSAAIQAGDVVRLAADDGVTDITVEPLSFDFSTSQGLVAVTSPLVTVQLSFQLSDGSTRRFERTGGADGRFHFGTDDVPAREGWALADVDAVELLLPITGGHEIVAAARFRTDRPGSLYLPLAVVRSR